MCDLANSARFMLQSHGTLDILNASQTEKQLRAVDQCYMPYMMVLIGVKGALKISMISYTQFAFFTLRDRGFLPLILNLNHGQ